MAATTPEEALEWEARQGPRAAIAAALGALLVIGSGVATATLFKDAPVTGFVDSLARGGRAGGVGSLPEPAHARTSSSTTTARSPCC